MSAVFNIMSFIFGGLAILLPLFVILLKKNKANIYSYFSLSFAILSLYCQICQYNHLANVQDWTAMLDTIDFISSFALAFIIIVIVLNAFIYIRKDKLS